MDKLKDFFISFILPMVITLLIFLGIWQFVGAPVTISGESMAPTLENSERVWLNRLASDYSRGDIIVFDAPDGSGDEYIKRVIGVPGDTVAFKDDTLYINGEAVDEPYLNVIRALNPGRQIMPNESLQTLPTTQASQVPEGKLFVLGDNRPVSKDGEEFGFIDQDTIKGTVPFRIWPLNKIGKIEPVDPQEVAIEQS
ncbi:MAG: signal peptidase I [Aerococcus sp.]|nr:signal peptidase I [Aerococcus sp.]